MARVKTYYQEHLVSPGFHDHDMAYYEATIYTMDREPPSIDEINRLLEEAAQEDKSDADDHE